jgi:putative phosphoesterase
MLIGIISDSHDNITLIKKTVEILNKKNVKLVLHAGDYVSPFTSRYFKQLKPSLIGVLGNCDGATELLKKRYSEIGAEIRGIFAEVTPVKGLKIALFHGHEEHLLYSLINSGGYDVVIHGHTHQAKVSKIGKTIVINPGELCGYLSNSATIALLDTDTCKTRVVEIG